jgi:hypothetical protein
LSNAPDDLDSVPRFYRPRPNWSVACKPLRGITKTFAPDTTNRTTQPLDRALSLSLGVGWIPGLFFTLCMIAFAIVISYTTVNIACSVLQWFPLYAVTILTSSKPKTDSLNIVQRKIYIQHRISINASCTSILVVLPSQPSQRRDAAMMPFDETPRHSAYVRRGFFPGFDSFLLLKCSPESVVLVTMVPTPTANTEQTTCVTY